MLSAGDAVAWLADLGVIASAEEVEDAARSVTSTDGVRFVPALSGLGSPHFDFGARSCFVGLTRGSSAAHLARAVLEGVAHTVADAAAAAGVSGPLRVDGGVARDRLLLEMVADLTGLVVERAPVVDATSLGAALWAGLATGVWSAREEAAALWPPAESIEPSGRDVSTDRAAWAEALAGAKEWLPEFSSLPL